MSMRVAIVGGGLTGLSAADELSQHGVHCTIFESDAAVGGLAGSFMVDGVLLQKFYHHLFTSDTAAAAMIERVGLGDKLEWAPSALSFFVNNIYRLSTPLDLLKFSTIGLFDRIRLGLLYLSTTRLGDWQALEGITARKWLIGMAGQTVYRKVWELLLRGKFGKYADDVAVAWILAAYLPHLQKMFRGFARAWVKEVSAWRERYTQPVIGRQYSQLRPPFQTPVANLWLCCMAQVYPEDRGMNYAIVFGQRAADEILKGM